MRAVLLLALVACNNPWPDYEGGSPIEESAALGTLIADGSVFRDTFIAGTFTGDRLIVSLHEGAGFAEDGATVTEQNRFVEVTRAGAATVLPAAPVTSAINFASTADDSLVVAGAEGVAAFTGGAWQLAPLPPGVTTEQVYVFGARDASAYVLTTSTEVFLWNGSAWSTLALTAEPDTFRIVAVSSEGFRLVYGVGGDLHVAKLAWETGAELGPDAVLPVATIVSGTANGTLDDFQLIANPGGGPSTVWFHAGMVEPLGQVGDSNRMLPSPGSQRVVMIDQSFDGFAVPMGTLVEGGVPGAQVFAREEANVPCGCTRDDPACMCLAHRVTALPVVGEGATTLALVALSDLNGHRAIYARFEPLPFAGPWLTE